MRIALCENKRISAEKADKFHEYICPLCQEEVILKKGRIIPAYFSHKIHASCKDSFHHEEMTPWHLYFQSLFPEDQIEVVISSENEKHRADALIHKTIFEFQHSSMSYQEFDKRNQFYTKLGYHLIWLFDMKEEYDKGNIKESMKRNNLFEFDSPLSTFKHLDLKENITLLFQLGGRGEKESDHPIVKIEWKNDNFTRFIAKQVKFSSYIHPKS